MFDGRVRKKKKTNKKTKQKQSKQTKSQLTPGAAAFQNC